MKNLKKYCEERNVWQRWAKKPEFNVKALTTTQMNELYSAIDAGLSPENLCCDGELTGGKLRRKAAMLHGAKAELEALAKAAGHTLVLSYAW